MPRSSKTASLRAAAAVVALSTTLVACSDIYLDRRETVALNADNAVATNRIVQTIDPWPAHASNNNIAYNGDKMRSAAERYRTGKIVEPQGLGTTSNWKQQSTGTGGALDTDIGTAKSAK
jgi:hypothetical protein